MSNLQTIASIIAAVVLFLYGLEGFSRELEAVGKGAFQRIMTQLTKTRYRGFMLGVVVTALLQSSSAVSSITVALVDSGAITFRNSLGILLGANVGTTSTSWLVSFKLTGIGPYFIVLGALANLAPARIRVFGKVIFYFGFVLLALDLVGQSLQPIRTWPLLKKLLGNSASLPLAALSGLVVTALVQSSSVTSGLVILLVQQGGVATAAAIAVVVGANAGTTATSLIASVKMSRAAKRAARAHLIFNLAGVLVFLPFLAQFSAFIHRVTSDPSMSVAFAHLFFNVAIAVPFLVFLRPYERLLLKLYPETNVGDANSH
jgi:phosphate:Na+ symporter